ncbi:MAG: IS5 family transposase [Methanomicrobiales archaeon]
MNAIRESKIPLYSSKFSRKDYNQLQLLALLVFKEYLGVRYREIVELVEGMGAIQTRLGITRIPHFTTLCKFSSRISSTILTEVQKQATNFSYHDTGRVSTIAIDSTGFPTEYFSYYYSMRTEKTRRDFIKISLAVDTEKQTILGTKITKSRQHDTKHASPLLRNTMKKAECYVLDRGYDSEQIHLQIRTEIHAESIIPIRDWNADYVNGQYRNEMAENFDRERYGQRNKVETVFSVIKRRFGDEIKARFYRSQVKELKLKCIVYSVDLFLKKQRIFITD